MQFEHQTRAGIIQVGLTCAEGTRMIVVTELITTINSLISIGDNVTLNHDRTLQIHLYENGTDSTRKQLSNGFGSSGII